MGGKKMSNKIDLKKHPIPTLPPEIINAIEQGSLILFVGAGVSKLFGFPLWKELGEKLADKAIEKKRLTRSQKKELFQGNFTPVEIITLLINRFEQKSKGSGYKNIRQLLSDKKRLQKDNIKLITECLSTYNALIVTTNADETLEKSQALRDRYVYANFKDYPDAKNDCAIIHLHGCVTDPNNMIFTSQSYAMHYMVENDFGKNLKDRILSQHTILFIGYSISEFELIRYFLLAAKEQGVQLFKLDGYLEGEALKLDLDKEYLQSLGITLLPYSREKKDYEALIDVLKSWDKEIKESTFATTVRFAEIIKDVISNGVNNYSLKVISEKLSKVKDNEANFILRELAKSPELPQWIIGLKDSVFLFSAKNNIQPCLQLGDGTVQSQTWKGLYLFEIYCQNGWADKDVDAFIIKKLKESISIYKKDKETDRLKRLSSSVSILISLFKIAISKALFIDKVNVSFLASLILKEHYKGWFSMLVSQIQEHESVLFSASQDKVFKLFITIIKNVEETSIYDYYEDLVIPNLILKNPTPYYNFSLNWLQKNKKDYWNMGSFQKYIEEFNTKKDSIYFQLLLVSSKGIETVKLHRDIESLVQSDIPLQRKAGLALLSINFPRCQNLFWDHLHEFMNNEDYYADLCLLIKQNFNDTFFKQNQKNLVAKTNTATFGGKNQWQINTLKNHFYYYLKPFDLNISYQEETSDDLAFSNNFNKRIYAYPLSVNELEASIESKIENLSEEEILAEYEQSSNNSRLLYDAFTNVLIRRLLKKKDRDMIEQAAYYGPRLMRKLFLESMNLEENRKNILLEALFEKYIVIIEKDKRFEDEMPAALNCLVTIEKSLSNTHFAELFSKINYRKIPCEELLDINQLIEETTNNTLYTYLHLLMNLNVEELISNDKVIETIDYFKEKFNTQTLKSILASIYTSLVKTNYNYALSLTDYIFNNIYHNQNISYPLISFSNRYNEQALHLLYKQPGFVEYLKTKNKDNLNEMNRECLFRWFLWGYLSKEIFEEEIDILFALRDLDLISDNFNCFCDYFSEETEPKQQHQHYLDKFKNSVISHDFGGVPTDHLISDVAELISKFPENKTLWDILQELFKGYHCYFSDECVHLVELYQNSKPKEIKYILSCFFGSFDPYLCFFNTLKNVYNLIKDNPKYKKDLTKWLNNLYKKDVSIKEHLEP